MGCEGVADGVSAPASATAGVFSGATPGVLAFSDSRNPSLIEARSERRELIGRQL